MNRHSLLHALVALATAFFTIGCGREGPSTSSVSASLLIPRALADELTDVTIFLIETHQETHQPTCAVLLADTEAYKNADVERSVPVKFVSAMTPVLIKGIPDRGLVWRFYARGFQDTLLIAHGCNPGLWDVSASEPIQVDIDLLRTN